jgi:hypothetical protein
MGRLRDLLLGLGRIGRETHGGSAYPEPPGLTVPPEVREYVDGPTDEPGPGGGSEK